MKVTKFLKSACKNSNAKNFKMAKLWNKNGKQIFNEYLFMLSHGDIVYFAV